MDQPLDNVQFGEGRKAVHVQAQLVTRPQVIRIDEGNEFPMRLADPKVAGCRRTCVGLVKIVYSLAETGCHPGSSVSRAVVDDDQLHWAVSLPQDTGDRLRQEVFPIVDWQDYTDEGIVHDGCLNPVQASPTPGGE